MEAAIVRVVCCLFVVLICCPLLGANPRDQQETIRLRAWGVPSGFSIGPVHEAQRQIMEEFRRKYPWIDPVSTVGLIIPGGSRTMDMVPFMQIAGDIAPDVMYVNFRQSHTYIEMKLLYPLEEYVEQWIGANLPDSSRLENDHYLAELSKADGWPALQRRVSPPCWPVIRRRCPFERDCQHRKDDDLEPLERHWHIWAFPVAPCVMGLAYDRSIFAEHADEGVEMRAPRDWDEMLRWCQLMTDPEQSRYGLEAHVALPAWCFLSFLYSAGGRVVEETEDGNWKCVLDSEEAVEAAWFYCRMYMEKFQKNGKTYEGVLGAGADASRGPIRFAMRFSYLDERFLTSAADSPTLSFAPVPLGPTGKRGSEFNAQMCGIFAGIGNDIPRRDAAWNYIQFYDGEDARRIRTEKLIEAGMGRYIRRFLLEQYNHDGRYDDLIRQSPPELEETYRLALAGGVPEPYGKNCQYVYDQMSKPLGEILQSADVREAVNAGEVEQGKALIRRILGRGTAAMNEKMLGNLPPPVQQRRQWVSWAVITAVVVIFYFVMRKVFRTFRPPQEIDRAGWQIGRYWMAYLLMLPALSSIALWMYWPTLRGSVIAFQNYSVLGDSTYVGAANFADVLFDNEFWYSLRVSLVYAVLFMIFGFWVPIALAFLLSEVPRGKVLFRIIYYLPAILSGVVVIFLWKSFYGPTGLINQVLNGPIFLINWLFGVSIGLFQSNWLEDRNMALFFCLLPTVWAGMGPGCLIYLAALKTVPDELYEAADLDGAGIFSKVFRVSLPSIRALVAINFIGAMIGAIRGAGGFVLAMTGGGPFTETGGATEVIGLKLFYTTFGYLKFGAGAAMAWVLGAMLIGFTVIQLQRISKLEFRTTEKVT